MLYLAEFLEKIEAIPPAYRPRLSNPGRFKNELKDLIRDEFLADEAEKMNLRRHPEVEKQVDWWREELLASKLKSELVKDIVVTSEEIESYFQENKDIFGNELNDEIKEEITYRVLSQKQDSVITAFVNVLKSKTSVTFNDQEFARDLDQLGGEKAGFLVVFKVRQ